MTNHTQTNVPEWRQQRFMIMTLDPVHIGTGGYRLGRVDLSISREPGTKMPKLPGTSLSGAARSYAAMRKGDLRCAKQKGQCGKPDCPVCYTFGSLEMQKGDKIVPHSGTVNIFDAQIVLFPIHSMAGPVWATTVYRLKAVGFEVENATPPDDETTVLTMAWVGKPLNLGWLMLETQAGARLTQVPGDLANSEGWQAVQGRIAFVTEKVFSQVVNSNLEVRTSVSIDPFTGAAESGALFTYEAIPRATWLTFDVVLDNFRKEPFPVTQVLGNSPIDVVRKGLELAQLLGVGGMGTRGFGRIKIMADWEATPEEVQA